MVEYILCGPRKDNVFKDWVTEEEKDIKNINFFFSYTLEFHENLRVVK